MRAVKFTYLDDKTNINHIEFLPSHAAFVARRKELAAAGHMKARGGKETPVEIPDKKADLLVWLTEQMRAAA